MDYISSVTAVPNGNIFLLVIWGNGDWDHQRVAPTPKVKKGGIYILGQHFEINNFSTKANLMDLLAFELNPIVFHRLFSISPKSIVNQLICMQEIFPHESAAIGSTAAGEKCVTKQLSAMEDFLWARIQNKTENNHHVLSQAISIIEQHHGNICIKKLAEMLQICTRSLERRFLEILGIPPKSYSKIIQFNYAFRLLAQNNKKIGDIALEAGYYDQPHFVRQFRKASGICPTHFCSTHQLTGNKGKKTNSNTAFLLHRTTFI
ncbi:MAG: AraC family transcriptional regulator [Cyclobacteriaceae bacterium]